MGYGVKTEHGVDFYEDAVKITTQEAILPTSSCYLVLKDAENEVIAVYPPFKWECAGVSSSRTLPTSTEPSVPPEVFDVLDNYVKTSDEKGTITYNIVSKFVEMYQP